MIFVGNDSLSELVWSPRRGLSVRCAVGTVAEPRSSFFRGAGSSDMALSPPHNTATEDTASIPPPTTSKDDRNMTTFRSGQAPESGSTESMNNVQVDTMALYTTRGGGVSHRGNTVAVHEAVLSSSPGLEDVRLRNTLPDSEDGLLHAGDKLECVAENDLPPSDRFPRDSPVNVRISLHGGTEQFQLRVCEISKAAPITALASEAKGKERTFPDHDLRKEASRDEDDDSYESVESSNSARKKRVLSFNEQLIVKSKRLKMQIRETPGSSSFTRSNSSFANWISAMVKGLSRPDEDGKASLASPSTTTGKEQHKTCDMGFQSLFRSIYRPSTKLQDQRLLCSDNYQWSEGCKQLKLAENSGQGKSNSDNTSKSLSQSPIPGRATQDALLHSKTDASDSTATRNVGKRVIDSFNTSCSDLPSAEKLVHASAKKDDHLSSLFMTHFCPKSPIRVMNAAGSSGIPRKNVELQGSCSEEPTKSSSFKKRHAFPLDVEANCTVKEVEAQNIKQSVHFQRFQGSEAMACVFAKRLDALKNITPTDLTDKSASSAATCFYCGAVGHDLRYCPQLTEAEGEELVRNMAAYGGREESPCLCIRCFQLSHWAVACPNAPARKKQGGALFQRTSAGGIWHGKGVVRNLSLPDVIDRQAQALRAMGSPLGVSTGFRAESVEKVPSSYRNLSEENAAELPWFPYPCGSLGMPRGIFEAVKSLQLSRTDIMKWMNSIFSTSLDGYYLRLRQKLGDVNGGTQYHVACICSPQDRKSAETSKRPIYVAVGGIRCSVESQYISNQDFLEDELKEWWSATLRGDHGKIPSEDELRSKVEERRRLGL